MSKKTIDVFEIYRANSEIEILEVGSEYAKNNKKWYSNTSYSYG